MAFVRMVDLETAELGGSPAILPPPLTVRSRPPLLQPLVTQLTPSSLAEAADGASDWQPLPKPLDEELPLGQSIEWTTHAGHRLP